MREFKIKILIVTSDYSKKDIIQKESIKNDVFMEYTKTISEAFTMIEKTDFALIVINTDSVDYNAGIEKMLKVKPIPVLLLSYSKSENKISAIENGALKYSFDVYSDDYLLKSSMELIKTYAKIQKNSNYITPVLLSYRYIDMYVETYQVFVKGEQILLTKKEFDLLKYFMTNVGIVLTYGQIYDNVWADDNSFNSTNILHSLIRRLRIKIKSEPDSDEYITVFQGTGYKFGT